MFAMKMSPTFSSSPVIRNPLVDPSDTRPRSHAACFDPTTGKIDLTKYMKYQRFLEYYGRYLVARWPGANPI